MHEEKIENIKPSVQLRISVRNNLEHDLDEMAGEAHMSEEKAQKAMIDAARLADELMS